MDASFELESNASLDGLSGRQFKPFACPDCDKHFTRLTYVQRHQRLAHLGKRDHVCSKCGSGFARSDVLSRHMQTCGNGKVRKRKPSTSDTVSPIEQTPVSTGIPVNYSVNAFLDNANAFPLPNGRPMPAFGSHSGSSDGNSPLFDRAGSGTGSTPGSDVVASPEQAPLFSELSKNSSDVSLSSGNSSSLVATPTSGLNPFDPYAEMPEGFDPFAPLALTPGAFNWTAGLGSPGLAADANSSFFDLMAAASVHQPSPLTFRNPEPKYSVEAIARSYVIDPNDGRFQLGPERIAMITAIGLQKKFKFPNAQGFERLAAMAAQTFATFNPVIHMPTFNLNTDDLSIGVALATVGATKNKPRDVEGAKEMADHILKEKRDFYIQDFAKRTVEIESSGGFIGCGEGWTGVIRSFLIYQTIGFSHADKTQRRLSASYHGALINMMRLVGFVNKTRESVAYQQSLLPGGRPLDSLNPQQLDAHWRKVMEAEQFSRTAWMIWLIDLALAGCHKTPASLTLAEFGSLRLPITEACWTATAPAEWALMDAVYAGPPPTLTSALRSALGSVNAPPLDGLGAFAAAVLRRTIGYLAGRLNKAPPVAPGDEVDSAVHMLWSELGLMNPPASRQAAAMRLDMAMQTIDRACPMPDLPGYQQPGGCTLSSLDEGLD